MHREKIMHIACAGGEEPIRVVINLDSETVMEWFEFSENAIKHFLMQASNNSLENCHFNLDNLVAVLRRFVRHEIDATSESY